MTPRSQGVSSFHLGEAARRTGQLQESETYLERALKAYQQSQDRQGLSDTMVALSGSLADPGEDHLTRLKRAERLLKDALEIKRAIGDRHGVAEVFRYLGTQKHVQGDLEAAEHFLHQALRMHEALGALYHIAASQNSLAICKMYLGNYDAADELFLRAITIFNRVGDDLAISHTMVNRGALAMNRLAIDEAYDILTRAKEIKEGLGSTWGLYETYNYLALAMMWRGEFERADALVLATIDEHNDAVAESERVVARSLLGLLRCFQSRLQVAALRTRQSTGSSRATQ